MNLDHDIYLGASEFRPDNRRTVHHALLFADVSGQAHLLNPASGTGSDQIAARTQLAAFMSTFMILVIGYLASFFGFWVSAPHLLAWQGV